MVSGLVNYTHFGIGRRPKTLAQALGNDQTRVITPTHLGIDIRKAADALVALWDKRGPQTAKDHFIINYTSAQKAALIIELSRDTGNRGRNRLRSNIAMELTRADDPHGVHRASRRSHH